MAKKIYDVLQTLSYLELYLDKIAQGESITWKEVYPDSDEGTVLNINFRKKNSDGVRGALTVEGEDITRDAPVEDGRHTHSNSVTNLRRRIEKDIEDYKTQYHALWIEQQGIIGEILFCAVELGYIATERTQAKYLEKE